MSNILPLWDAYVKYPLPTERGTCAMATGISEKMDGPHVEDSLSPWTWTKPPSSSCLCPYCNKSQQQGFTHEPHSIPLQDGPGVSDMRQLWVESKGDCQRTYQEMCCSST